MQCCSTDLSKISLKFTDKASFFDDLSVSKTHFTDKPAFSGDLSVNFCPLWWGFTDKRLFSEHLSVKPGPKRLNFYGQTAIFAHFVRNRHFSERPFTDKFPIFIDVSVIGSDFPNAVPDESARQALRPIFRQIISGYFRHGRQSSCMRKKPDQICNWAQSIRGFNWNIIFPNFLSVWGKFFSFSIANQNAKSLDFRHLFFAKAW